LPGKQKTFAKARAKKKSREGGGDDERGMAKAWIKTEQLRNYPNDEEN